jgi:hypothetical protein
MKNLLVIGAALAALFVGYTLYTGGALNKGGVSGGSGTDAVRNGGQQAVDKGQVWWSDLAHQPWFYTALGAVILGGLGIMLWKRIGGFGRGFALVLLGLGLALFLSKVGG